MTFSFSFTIWEFAIKGLLSTLIILSFLEDIKNIGEKRVITPDITVKSVFFGLFLIVLIVFA